MIRYTRVLFLGAALMVTPLSSADAASTLRDFLAAAAEAYGHYRGAVNYLRTGNLDLGALELEAASEQWESVLARFASAPPDAFADDPDWRAGLLAIDMQLEIGLAEADAGYPEQARRTLAPVRALLAELRQRNNIRVFSDRVDELSAAMGRLWRFHEAPPDLASPEARRNLRAETAVLGYLFEQCGREAPAGIKGKPEFERLIAGAAEGIERMWRAIDSADPDLLINTLRELKSFETILYLRFG